MSAILICNNSTGSNHWMNIKLGALLVSIALLVSGCVTTTNSSFTRKADTEEAVKRYVQLGLEYIKRDEYARARKHLQRALEIDENNAAATSALGLIYHEDGESKLAEELFLNALDYDETYTRGRTYYGAFLFSEGRYKEALSQFEIASKDTGYVGRAGIYTNVALCNLKLGNSVAAITAYEKTLKLDRLNGRALSGITELYIERESFDSANKFYNRLIRLIAQQGLRHSPQSLWQGIRIAHFYGSAEQVASFGALLEELYPNSSEYGQYKLLLGKG